MSHLCETFPQTCGILTQTTTHLSINRCLSVIKSNTMTQSREKYSRAIPFVRVLDKSNARVNKCDVLKKFPTYVTNDIIEILHNVLVGILPIKAKQKMALAKHKNQMHEFAKLPSLKMRRKFLYKQKGGFLGTILPIIASVLGNLFT